MTVKSFNFFGASLILIMIFCEGVDSETVSDMLVYIYGGKIDNIEEKSDKLLAASDQVVVGCW